MRKKLSNLVFLIVWLSLISGCVSIPQQKFDKKSYSNIKTIALLDIPNPSDYIVMNTGGVDMLFGAIGGLVGGIDGVSKSERLTQSMVKEDLKLGDELLSRLKESLTAMGYKVIVLDGIRPEIDDKDMADYSKIQTEADAILDVWYVITGYLSSGSFSDYKPWVRVSSRMVSTSDKSPLYFQIFSYGTDFATDDNIIHFQDNKVHAYRSFDALIENKTDAKKGLLLSVPVISEGIASQLR